MGTFLFGEQLCQYGEFRLYCLFRRYIEAVSRELKGVGKGSEVVKKGMKG